MRRPWPLWTIFALCLFAGLAGMLWISATILRLDRAEADARRQGQIEESVHLALWRMDSSLAPLIAQETARPYFAYRAFTPAGRAYTRMFNRFQGELLIPSPLLAQEIALVNLHFQLDPSGQLTSPQVPTGTERTLIQRDADLIEKINAAGILLARAKDLVHRDALLAALPENRPAELYAVRPRPQLNAMMQGEEPQEKPFMQQQAMRNSSEWQARSANTMTQNRDFMNQRAQQNPTGGDVREGVMKPLWVGSELLLARRVTINNEDYVQAYWLNWPAIRKSLLDNIADLLPNADLSPWKNADARRESRLLASIPIMLIPGRVPLLPDSAPLPVRAILAVAWAGLAIAALAAGLLVWGAMRLSARRAAFVSAVTHELRTPLTTVSMYAEMLEAGMVGEQSRQQYLSTLRAESERLGHLVENVLAYSRIERGGLRGRIQTIPLPQLIESTRQRLETRAKQADLQLELRLSPAASATSVRADASAVEQILFNLVDNASKYASAAADKRIDLSADANGSNITIHVRDFGPGISPQHARKLFRPFSKTATEAATSKPGVGLGLALSRRLARQMSGDLSLESSDQGACFVLTLPRSMS